MDNLQFATATHILTLLAGAKENLSSTYLAGSININPAVVRKSLVILREQGLVDTKEGKGGGVKLAKPASAILLSDIYKAVNNTPLLGHTNHPNPECPVGRQINDHLYELNAEADRAIMRKLEGISLQEFYRKFR